jgi:hypothetical protein
MSEMSQQRSLGEDCVASGAKADIRFFGFAPAARARQVGLGPSKRLWISDWQNISARARHAKPKTAGYFNLC